MKRNTGIVQRFFVVLLVFSMIMAALSACSNTAGTNSPTPTAKPSAAAATPSSSGTVTITDMSGRTVTYPENPQKIFSATPASEAWLCALVPDRLIGWSNTMKPEQLAYYPASVANVPLVGGWYGYTEGNSEGIITKAPDVVVTASDLSSESAIKSSAQSADQLSKKLGIPVICVSYDLKDIPQVMRLLGKWVGAADRGEQLAKYLQGELDKVSATIGKVPADKVVSYYYAEDDSGLKTESADSFHSAVFIFCGMKCANNVKMSSFMGQEQVSMEQIVNWNPQYIFAFSKNAYTKIKAGGSWADISAVKNGKVFPCPSWPQNWFDRSPNALRVLGCLYTAATCYPEYCTYNLDTELGQFFKTMYNRDLTTDQIHALYQ